MKIDLQSRRKPKKIQEPSVNIWMAELFQVFLKCYTRAQLRVLDSWQFSTEEDTRKSPKLPVKSKKRNKFCSADTPPQY